MKNPLPLQALSVELVKGHCAFISPLKRNIKNANKIVNLRPQDLKLCKNNFMQVPK